MKTIYGERKSGTGWKRFVARGVASAMAGALSLTPVAAARNGSAASRVVNERAIDRTRVENLQRWVNSGHADWCKDARLVAAEELWRLAPDFSGDSLEMSKMESGADPIDGSRLTFEWTPMDGRATYRVTVVRFEWLKPIAKTTDAIVWVPTSAEIQAQQ